MPDWRRTEGHDAIDDGVPITRCVRPKFTEKTPSSAIIFLYILRRKSRRREDPFKLAPRETVVRVEKTAVGTDGGVTFKRPEDIHFLHRRVMAIWSMTGLSRQSGTNRKICFLSASVAATMPMSSMFSCGCTTVLASSHPCVNRLPRRSFISVRGCTGVGAMTSVPGSKLSKSSSSTVSRPPTAPGKKKRSAGSVTVGGTTNVGAREASMPSSFTTSNRGRTFLTVDATGVDVLPLRACSSLLMAFRERRHRFKAGSSLRRRTGQPDTSRLVRAANRLMLNDEVGTAAEGCPDRRSYRRRRRGPTGCRPAESFEPTVW